MPELPDVETFKRYLDATSLHQEIEAGHVHDERVLKPAVSSALQRRLEGRRFDATRIANFDGPYRQGLISEGSSLQPNEYGIGLIYGSRAGRYRIDVLSKPND